ncbi:uncharacterized protein DSM5745_09450 [Aspergillus mulundensis]|uniref:Inner centromere protein ARK-binding domain-containing protein n=1 Tax=Aspergillus mulundensis TaxID=1810919 RepID=A0A3D8QVJ2_9EURO|nr:Uncharacterized protein DSM5745_09450 [Aspergillus mulundensis]RDW65711.1 Uncharacterized protein DSM5745_09450 [Aspergillus mulundensis]
MAAPGARAQKPVGSAAWISTEKENCSQLVDQEMEEIEFPVRYEMEWLNEHMAEVFSNNQLNFADVFKTPGKLRGKTPRTLRKRDPTENRVPLSEIFSSVQKNRVDPTYSASPAVQRSPTKAMTAPSAPTPPVASPAVPTPAAATPLAATPTAPTPSAQSKKKSPTPSQPEYPDLTQNINSFSQYNTDSGYHGMAEEDDDDEVVLTQVAPESQSTQSFDLEPIAVPEPRRSSIDRRTTDASFHSAREEVRHRGETVEPVNVVSPSQTREEQTPVAEPTKEAEPEADVVMEDEPAADHEVEAAPENTNAPAQNEESSPAKAAIAQPSSPKEPNLPEKDEKPKQDYEPEKDEMAIDDLDDIGSPSEKDSPERPPIRKSSLSFASLPAREPLAPKPLGSSRLSRTSHLDSIKPTAGSNYLGRQTGHRMTQTEKMDVDEPKETANEESHADANASKLHNKSSTQRLHEKISMLGKMQPSRPTKSIPAVPGLSSAAVSYPELPAVQPEAKQASSSSKPRETTPPQSPNAEDDWIKPMSSPFQTLLSARATASKPKSSDPATSDAAEEPSPIKTRATQELAKIHSRQTSEIARGKSATPVFSPQRYGHTKSASVNIDAKMTTTPIGSPRQDGPLSASKSRLQSIMRSAKGLFTSAAGVSAAAQIEASSPDEPRTQLQRANTDIARTSQRPLSVFSPPRQEGRRTRSSTEREEKRRQQELEERKREEELAEKARQQEKLRISQQKATRERSRTESEVRAPNIPSSPLRVPQHKTSREHEPAIEAAPKAAPQPSGPQAAKPNDRRPTKTTRESQQRPRPQPVSIRVGSALSRHMPLASSMASSAESSIPVPPPSASKVPSLKKKASNQSLHTAASNSSFKSSASSQTQRKAQLASERKREQEEREARRKEEQRREMERKRAAQQSRAEAERRERQIEDPKKAAQMQAIEKRRLENARRLERQGSQQPEMASTHAEKIAPQASQPPRPASRLGSVLGRTINPPAPNPAKPPKRGMEEENTRSAAAKPGAMQLSGETKRRRTDDEQNRASMRPAMAPPIRQSNIRKEPAKKPSMYGTGASQPGSSIFKTGQPQRPGHPMDMSKYASGKIPFAEPSNAGPSQSHRTPGPSSSKAAKPSPKYPDGEKIHLPEIATDSEDEDSEAEMLPVPTWAQPKHLETLLRDQEGMEVDSIFGPIAPFSLEETFKADKRIKKFRERTSSANWAGPDGLTQEEIRKDVAERQRLRLNGGWTFGM